MSFGPNSPDFSPAPNGGGADQQLPVHPASNVSRLKHAAHAIGTGATIAGGFTEGIYYVVNHIGALGVIAAYQNPILYGATFLSVFSGSAMLVRQRRIKKYAQYTSKLQEISQAQAQSLAADVQRLNGVVRKYQEPERLFRNLSSANAQCDKNIFDYLYKGINSGQYKLDQVLGAAHGLLEANIKDVLNTTERIFTAFTGSKCSVSIKLVSNVGAAGVHADDIRLKTFARDSDSQPERAAFDNKEYEVHPLCQ